MKKELIALSLFIVLFALSLVNIHFLDKLTGEIADIVTEAGVHARSEDWEAAKEKALEALETWERSDEYTHMVLRHSEIEAAGDTLGELLKEVYAQNSGAAEAAARAAASRMRSVASIEKIRLGSIF